jgi:anion-transporting  ArsA/GET3 family ATPase
MGLINIIDKNVKLIMVGGKGGVGKTTCASAISFKIAMDGRKVLIISSDPTPSLSDIFEVTIGSEEVRINNRYELYGLEITRDVVLTKWKERFGPEIYEVISSFADVDYDFVIVTIPEALGVNLTDRVIKDFEEKGLKVENIIINYVVRDEDCEFHKLRKKMQEGYINFIGNTYSNANIAKPYLSPKEVKGIESIGDVSKALFDNGEV